MVELSKGIRDSFFFDRRRGPMPGEQHRVRGQLQHAPANRRQMIRIQRQRIGPAHGSGEQRIADETQRPALGLDPVANSSGRMTGRGETLDPQIPHGKNLSVPGHDD